MLGLTSSSQTKVAATASEMEENDAMRRMSLARLETENKSAKTVVHEVIKEFEKERESLQNKAKTALLMTADDLNIGGVHVGDWEETGWAVLIVLLYYMAFFWAFFYFVYSLTLSGTATTYLSLESNTTEQTCVEIPISVTTTVNGDVYGRWSSNPLFLNNASIFALDFAGTNITTEQYVATMTSFKNKLEELGAKSAQRDVGWNSVMLSAFKFSDVNSGMSFMSTADPAYLYKSYVQMGLLTSAADSACINPFQLGQWDTTGNYLSYISKIPTVSHAYMYTGPMGLDNRTGWNDGLGGVEYNYDYGTQGTCKQEPFVCGYTNNKVPLDFQGKPVSFNGSDFVTALGSGCPNQFPYANYQPHWQMPYQFTNVFDKPFDIRTITAVISLNMQITTLDTYQIINSFSGIWATGGLPGSFYFDPYFPGMDPFFCIDKNALNHSGVVKMTKAQITGPELCFLAQQGSTAKLLYYPTSLSFWQAQDVNGTWYHCECPRDAKQQSCNERSFFISLFYDLMPGGQLTAQVPLSSAVNMAKFALQVQKFLLDDPVNGDLKMQTFFFPFFGSAWQTAAPAAAASLPYINGNGYNLGFLTDIHPGNTSNRDWHLSEWRKICPWGTCGSFVFYLQNDDTNTAVMPILNNYYQFSDFPYNNATFTATSAFQYSTHNTTWKPTENSLYKDIWHSTTQDRKSVMCTNNLYNEVMMSALVNSKPVNFVEPYFVCRKTVFAALKDAVGNAAGTAGMVAAIAMAVFGMIFRKVHNYRAKQAHKRYLEGKDDGRSIVMDKVLKEQIEDKLDERRNSAVYLLLRELVKENEEQRRQNELLIDKVRQMEDSSVTLFESSSNTGAAAAAAAATATVSSKTPGAEFERGNRIRLLLEAIKQCEEFDINRSSDVHNLV